jgi:hypothetical protein
VSGVVLARTLDSGAASGDTGGAHRSDEMERQHDETHGDDREADCVERDGHETRDGSIP